MSSCPITARPVGVDPLFGRVETMTGAAQNSLGRTARLAGLLYLILPPLGFFSFVYVPSAIAAGEAATTSGKLLDAEGLVRAGAFVHLLSQVVVVFLALAMFRVFRQERPERALLMLVLALLCVPISFVSEVQHLAALDLLHTTGNGVLTAAQVELEVERALAAYDTTVLVAQIFWGLWSVVLGSIVLRSRLVPSFLGLVAVVAGSGYLVDSVAHLLALDLPTVSQFTFLAELPLPVWLVARGVD